MSEQKPGGEQPNERQAPAEQTQEDLVRKNKMGHMPIGPLLVNVSVPIVLSMLVQALYNVVDSIFVARISEDALAAVGLVFPIQNLMIAVAVGTGVGINSLLSRRLGEQNVEGANRVATNGLFLALLSWVAFALVGLFGSGLFFSAFSGDASIGPHITEMGTTYMKWVTIASPGLFFSITLERLLQATGRSFYTMISQGVGAIVNIILDPIMIFGLLGFPALGVTGAAIATIIGQLISMLLAIWFNLAKNHELCIRLRGFTPSATTIKHIYQVGLPSIVMQSIGSVMTFSMNKILAGFGTTAVSVFNIYFKVQSFVIMPVIGFNNGMVPIIAFNYGARNRLRIERTLRLSLYIAVAIMTTGTLVFWLLPTQILSLFDATESMMEMGVPALRIISVCFPMAAVAIVFTGVFQALGQGLYSLIMSLVRQLVLLVPIAWLLAHFYGMPALWAAFPIAESSSMVLAIIFARRVLREKVYPLDRKANSA